MTKPCSRNKTSVPNPGIDSENRYSFQKVRKFRMATVISRGMIIGV